MKKPQVLVRVFICGLLLLLATPIADAADRAISLAGQWRFIRGGPQTEDQPRALPQLTWSDSINLPGTTDTNQKGTPSSDHSNNSFTQPYSFTGTCWYERDVTPPESWRHKRVTLFLERTKYTQVWLDGQAVGDNPICCTPQEYTLSVDLLPGIRKLTIAVNNQRLPPSGADSHQFSGNTQGNWNGIIGKIEMRMTDAAWIEDVQIYPDAALHQATVKVRLDNIEGSKGEGLLTISTKGQGIADNATTTTKVQWPSGGATTEVELSLGSNAALWNEFHPTLHQLIVHLEEQ